MLTAYSIKIKVLFISLLLFLFLGATFTYAQSSGEELEPINSENYNSLIHTPYTFSTMINGLGCLIEGRSILGSKCPFFVSGPAGQQSAVPYLFDKAPEAGALGGVQTIMVAMYANPPARTAEYLANISRDLGIIQEVHAQVGGSGAGVISPVFSLWEAARNVAYLGMTIIFLLAGLMIMFRRKLNPQTVVTIQLALPRLVIGLIMITFSYFFASLIVDIAFLGSLVVGQFFVLAGVTDAENVRRILDQENVITIFSQFIGLQNLNDTAASLGTIFNNLQGLAGTLVGLVSGVIGCGIGRAISETFDIGVLRVPPIAGCTIAAGITATSGGSIIGLLLYAVLLIGLVFSMFRLLVALITKYVQIIFLTLSAPFQFMLGSLPGNDKIIPNWFKSMICNVLAFPAVFGAFYLAAYFVGPNTTFFEIQSEGANFGQVPQTLPLFGNLGVAIIRVAIAYGILLTIPGIPNWICEILNPPANREAGRAISGAITRNVGSGTGGLTQLRGLLPGGRI